MKHTNMDNSILINILKPLKDDVDRESQLRFYIFMVNIDINSILGIIDCFESESGKLTAFKIILLQKLPTDNSISPYVMKTLLNMLKYDDSKIYLILNIYTTIVDYLTYSDISIILDAFVTTPIKLYVLGKLVPYVQNSNKFNVEHIRKILDVIYLDKYKLDAIKIMINGIDNGMLKDHILLTLLDSMWLDKYKIDTILYLCNNYHIHIVFDSILKIINGIKLDNYKLVIIRILDKYNIISSITHINLLTLLHIINIPNDQLQTIILLKQKLIKINSNELDMFCINLHKILDKDIYLVSCRELGITIKKQRLSNKKSFRHSFIEAK